MTHSDMTQSVIERDTAANAADILAKPKIGQNELRRANAILKMYRHGKLHLEQRIIDN